MNSARSSARRDCTEICTRRRPSLSILRYHAGDAHIRRQRRLEQIEQLGPGERSPIDQRVRLGGGRLHGVELDAIDGATNHGRLVAQVACLGIVLRDGLARVAALSLQPHDLVGIEQRQTERQRRERAERPRGSRARCRKAGSKGCYAASVAAFRSRSSMPTSGASTSSRSSGGVDPILQASRAARIHRFHGHVQALFESSPHVLGAARQPRAAGDHHAGKAAAIEAIFVIHRRLMNQVRERPFGFAAIAEKQQRVVAHDGQREIGARHVHQQPVAARRRRARRMLLMTPNVERSTRPA